MCGIFGVLSYGAVVPKLAVLVKELGRACSVRGTDATGISFNHKHNMIIDKAPQSSLMFKFTVPKDVRAVMGHTRRTTQGNYRDNQNNHPFEGQLEDGSKFAFAHNGVLDNEFELKEDYKLPKTKIVTDSYVACQLTEHVGTLSLKSLKQVGEAVEGMFCFTYLDAEDNLFFVRNDSPLAIVHFPQLKLYAYASTDGIMLEALEAWNSNLLIKALKGEEKMEWFNPKEGTITKITNKGNVHTKKFKPQERYSWKNWGARQIASGHGSSTKRFGFGAWDDYGWEAGSGYTSYSDYSTSGIGKSTDGVKIDEEIETIHGKYDDDDIEYINDLLETAKKLGFEINYTAFKVAGYSLIDLEWGVCEAQGGDKSFLEEVYDYTKQLEGLKVEDVFPIDDPDEVEGEGVEAKETEEISDEGKELIEFTERLQNRESFRLKDIKRDTTEDEEPVTGVHLRLKN